jgi:hypothetical protein
VTSGYFYTLAGKTKLKVFEGEFEGELFSKSSALNKSLVTLLYEYHTYGGDLFIYGKAAVRLPFYQS